MNLYDIINPKQIFFLDTIKVEDTLQKMVNEAHLLSYIHDEKLFYNQLIEREESFSTGIGYGISIPHIHSDNIEEFFILIGISANGLDWDSVDRKPVRAVFLIGGSKKNQNLYLQTMSKIALLAKNKKRREILFKSTDKNLVINFFKDF